MSKPDTDQLLQLVKSWIDPRTQQPLGDRGTVEVIQAESPIKLKITVPYAAKSLESTFADELNAHLSAQGVADSVSVELVPAIAESVANNKLPALSGVRNIIAVASGKGGVGKSTTTVNLALALKAQGAKVGILDADIYGPSQGMMLGISGGQRPEVANEKYFLPLEKYGLQVMSMSFLVDEDQPMAWRGPMASGALQQLITETLWQDLDFLLIDMPPGTGDIQLTLSQKVPVSAAVIVTTPQDIALLDAKKGVELFRKVDIPVLGIVENMSTHICTNCGHEEAIFGAGGGQSLAEKYGCELLGQLPLALPVREQTDSGCPSVEAEPQGPIAQRYLEIAWKTSAALARQQSVQVAGPGISMVDD